MLSLQAPPTTGISCTRQTKCSESPEHHSQ